jgi:hypothetical protein
MPRARKANPVRSFIDQLAAAIASRILAGSVPRKTTSRRARVHRKQSISAEGLARIRAAQKKRWAAWRKAKGRH